MRLTLAWFGYELDVSFGPTTGDDEPEPESRGDIVSTPIGFAPTPHPGWERPLNGWDEPADDQEDT